MHPALSTYFLFLKFKVAIRCSRKATVLSLTNYLG